MHVLWVTEAAEFLGGAERHVADTAGLLSGEGFRSTLLFGAGRPTDPAFTGRFDGAFPRVDVPRQVRDLGPDLIYVHQLRSIAVTRELADTGIPVVRFFHDHDLFCLRSHKYTTLGRRTCRRTMGWSCYPCLGSFNRKDGWPGLRFVTVRSLRDEQRENQRFDAFITASGYMRDHVIAHGFDPGKVHLNPLFVAPPDREPSNRREEGRLLFVGSLLRGKGLDVLLDALADLDPSVHLTVVGTGEQEGLLRERTGSLGLDTRVKFAGRLEAGELEEQYRRAACLVIPSREPETFCLVGPEAFRHGTPVVASDVGGVGEWLEDGGTGLLFPSGDGKALARAITEMLEDGKRAEAMGIRGRALVLERFGPQRHVDELDRIFRRLVAVNGGGHE